MTASRAFRDQGDSLWDMSQSSRRWSLLRYSNRYHNTLTIGHHDQIVASRAEFISVGEHPHSSAVLDLSHVYRGQADRVIRSVSVPSPGRIVFGDTLKGVDPQTPVTFTWITDAEIHHELDHRLRLTKQSQSVTLSMMPAPGFRMTVSKLDDNRQSFETANPDVKVIQIISAGNETGTHRFEVELTSDP